MTLHQQRTHSEPVEGCFGCRLSSLQMATGLWRTMDQKRRDLELKEYEQARKEGSLPMTSRSGGAAMAESDKLGRAFRSDNLSDTYHPGLADEITSTIIRPDVVQEAMDNAQVA